MITFKDIEKICNYSETKTSTNVANYTYIHIETDEETKNRIKVEKRDSFIDSILDKDISNNISYPIFENNIDDRYISSLQPLVKSVLINAKSYKEPSEIYIDILQRLDKTTSTPKYYNGNNINQLNINNYSFEETKRKLMTRLLHINNIVAIESRIGPPNTLIYGLSVAKYIDESLLIGIYKNIICSPLIKNNKCIVIKTMKDSIGLTVINNIENNLYFIEEIENNNNVNYVEVI